MVQRAVPRSRLGVGVGGRLGPGGGQHHSGRTPARPQARGWCWPLFVHDAEARAVFFVGRRWGWWGRFAREGGRAGDGMGMGS